MSVEKYNRGKKWRHRGTITTKLFLKIGGSRVPVTAICTIESFLMYRKLSLRFNLPVIILSTLTGTANFAQSTLPVSIQPMAPSIIGGLNLIAGLIATISTFLKIQELMENHPDSRTRTREPKQEHSTPTRPAERGA